MTKGTKSRIWLAIGLAGVLYFFSRISWRELEKAISDAHGAQIALAILMVMCAQSILAARWLVLLRVHGVRISMYQAVRLTYLGLFYNNVMPGSIGGDLLKGWFITHHCDRDKHITAMTSVLVDRLTGLVSMIWIAAIASVFVDSSVRLGCGIPTRNLVWGILGCTVLVMIGYSSRRVRGFLLPVSLMQRLPLSMQIRQVDLAMRAYRHHCGAMSLAIGITVCTQCIIVAAVWVLAQALQLHRVGFVHCLMVMPVIWLISAAIPVPGGLGVIEYLFIPLFARAITPTASIPGDSAVSQAAMLALLHRTMITACSLPGALAPAFGGRNPASDSTSSIASPVSSRSVGQPRA